MDYYYLVVLRLLHITSSVFWAGSAIYLAAFVLPAVKSAGPEGGKFMQALARTNSLPMVMNIVSSISVVTGVLLVGKLSGDFSPNWFLSTHGMILLGGGLTALLSFTIGQTVNRPTVGKISALNKVIVAQGTAPNAEQIANLGALRMRLAIATNLIAWLLGFSVILMSMAKYF